MRTRLLYRDRDLRDASAAPPRTEELRRNLGLDRLLPTMAAGDDALYRVAEAVLLGDVASADDIRYRHEVLRDCLAHPGAVDDLRRIAARAVERERHNYFGLFTRATPDKVLYRSLDVLDMFLEAFTELRRPATGGAAASPRPASTRSSRASPRTSTTPTWRRCGSTSRGSGSRRAS